MEKSEKIDNMWLHKNLETILCETKSKDKEHHRGKYLPHIIDKGLPLLSKELLWIRKTLNIPIKNVQTWTNKAITKHK